VDEAEGPPVVEHVRSRELVGSILGGALVEASERGDEGERRVLAGDGGCACELGCPGRQAGEAELHGGGDGSWPERRDAPAFPGDELDSLSLQRLR
jgi:hypothetical protein